MRPERSLKIRRDVRDVILDAKVDVISIARIYSGENVCLPMIRARFDFLLSRIDEICER